MVVFRNKSFSLLLSVLILHSLASCSKENAFQENTVEIADINIVTTFPTGYVRNLYWTSNNQLLFRVNQELWGLDPVTLDTEMQDSGLTFDSNISQTYLPNEVSDILLANEILIGENPEHQKFIFIITESNTNDSSSLGETSRARRVAKVGTIESSNKNIIGEIETCLNDQVYWSNLGDTVVIQNVCTFQNAWLYSFQSDQLIAIDSLGGFTYVDSFSPDDSRFVYTIEGRDDNGRFLIPHIVNLNSLEITKVDLAFSKPVDWLGNQNLLLLTSNDRGESGFAGFGIQDVDSMRTQLLFVEEIETLLNFRRIEEATLSKNKKFIAFTTVIEPFQISELWIIEIK